jgi:Ni/Co efflux regulator RcnB
MKSTAIACAITAASLGFGSLSYAQGYDGGNRDGRRHDHAAYAGPQRQFERHQQPQFNQYSHYGHQGQWSGHTPQYTPQFAPQYRTQFHRGDRLPYQFRQHRYYVNDWRAHHLYAPPYGYQWVQDDGGDFLLVALATGLIANLLINQ